MSQDGFDAALAFVLKWEGGLSDDPNDPGGRTYRGITQAEYDKWRDARGQPRQDVANMQDAELRRIYATDYWAAAHCPELAAKEDLLQFDTGVNMGVVRSIRFLQQASGAGVDGVFGSLTLQAVQGTDYLTLVSSYCQIRADFYQALVQRKPVLGKFLAGWLNRLNALRFELGIPGFGPPSIQRSLAAPMASIPDYGVDPELDL